MSEMKRPRYKVEIVTTAFQITGEVEPVGPWIVYLNNPDRHVVPVHNARAVPIGVANTAAIDRSLLLVNRADICLIVLLEAAARESVSMMRHVEVTISHVGPLICRSEFHMGAEVSLLTFFDDLSGHFFPATNAEVYPLVTWPRPLPRKIDMVMLNRQQVKLFYNT